MPEIRAAYHDQVLLVAEEARNEVAPRMPPARWPLAARVSIIGLLLAGCAFGAAAWLLRGEATTAASSAALKGVKLYGGPAGTDQVLGAMHDGTYPVGYHPIDPAYGAHPGYLPVNPGYDQVGHGDVYHGSRPQPAQYHSAGYHHYYSHDHVYHHVSHSGTYFWWFVLLVILAVLACIALYFYIKEKK